MSEARTEPMGAGGLVVAASESEIGDTLEGRYRLDGRIGAGGMGAVWQARDLHLGRDVAIKLVTLSQPLTRARFVREGKVAARLNHPSLCRVYDVGEKGGVGHLVMELLAGETVYERVNRGRPDRRWRIATVAEVAHAMAAAHAQGLVHRDLKPDNLFLDRRAGVERVVVIDFGLAFLDGAEHGLGRLTQEDITGGTPQYMAPEQAQALTIGPAADVYALGCVLFELLAGRPPFEGAPAMVMTRQVFTTPPAVADLVADLDPELAELVGEMLAKAPARRPTMADVAARLDRWLHLGPARAPARVSSQEARVHRMVTRDLEATGAEPVGAVVGNLLVLGPIPDDVLVACAAVGLSARRLDDPGAVARAAAADPRTLVLAELDREQLARVCQLGLPVLAVVAKGDVDGAVALARVGTADVLTRPIQPEDAVRKLLRILRRMPPR
jgi:eukaryotic-like serine/threonine-protein kinase